MAKVAFVGAVARILWAGSDRFLAEEYFNALEKNAKARAEVLFQRMAEVGRIWDETKFRNEGGGIYCFKPGGHRFPCFIHGNDVVVTHGFKKQRGKMPRNELDRAKEARRRHMEGK